MTIKKKFIIEIEEVNENIYPLSKGGDCDLQFETAEGWNDNIAIMTLKGKRYFVDTDQLLAVLVMYLGKKG